MNSEQLEQLHIDLYNFKKEHLSTRHYETKRAINLALSVISMVKVELDLEDNNES